MNHTESLNTTMRNLLAAMACLSYGTTQSFNSAGGGGDEDRDPRPPGGDVAPLHEVWAAKYNRARDDDERQAVIQAAGKELDRERCQAPAERPAGETREEEQRRQTSRVLELHAEGAWTTNDMAMNTGLTIGQVKAIIATASLAAPAPVRDEDLAVEMYLSGMYTLRQIERRTNVPKDTVRRLGKRAA
jgi:hypothetical protein